MRNSLWILALAASAVFATETYRWVDEDGVIHYSDTPREGAEVVNIRPAQGYKPPAPTVPKAVFEDSDEEAGSAADEKDRDAAATDYTVEVARPQQEETLWNLEGQMDVSLNISPRLKRGDRIRVFVDGEEIKGTPGRNTSFTVSEIWKGAHTLRAGVYDSSGRELALSDTVRFYVQQTSTQNPNSLTSPANRPGGPNRPVRPTPRGGR
jgi:hypothetical protein